MDRRRLTGLIALIAVLLLIAGLTWYDATGYRPEMTVAFAPAQSTDESVPVGDTPIVPPASLSADQPATAAEATAPSPGAPEPAAAPSAEAAAPTTTESAPSQAADAAPAAAAEANPPAAASAPAAAEPPPAQAADTAPAAAPQEPPAAVAQTPATPAAADVVPTFDVVRVDPSGEAVIAGLAEPNATVEVLDGTAPIASAEANDRGEWAIALDKSLPPGTHDLAVRTTSKSRSITVLSDQRVAVEVPQSGSKDVLVVLNSPDDPSRVIEMPAPAEQKQPDVATAEPAPPSQPPSATAAEPPVAAAPQPPAEPQVASVPPAAEPSPPAKPAPPPPPEPAVTVAAVEADTAGDLYIAGTAVTGETVRIYFEDEMIGEAKPSPSGTWLLQIHREVAPGTYRIRADQIAEAGGKVIARAEVPFEREINVASLKATGSAGTAAGSGVSGKMPAVETVIIKRGDNLWRIARDAWGRGIRWSNIYQANRDQIRNPRRIYPGQVFMMPKVNSTARN